MRKKYFTLLLMFSCFALFAQNNVNINVTDAISALAIENADVTLNSSTLQTDVNGDVVFAAIADGVYPYTITNDCYLDVSGSVTVAGAQVFETATMNSQTSASVFIGSSSNMFGTFADGDITLTDGVNTYNKSVTEFDNLVTGVVFGTYDYTFTRPGACDVTGTLDVDCSTINAQSGNVPLFFLSADQTDASVFIGASSNMFGTFADGNINLTDGNNTYNQDVTEFDNLVMNVAFGTYDYTFTRAGACDVTGTVVVDCSTIDAQSGNVPLFFLSADQTDASVFIGASSNMFGTFADGNINLTDGNNTYNQDVTEFDNLVMNVAFGTYDYTFTRAGACDVTGTVVVDCSTIDAQSGNVPLFFLSEDQTDASVFIGSSSNMFGTFADGNINLTDGNNTYNQDVTEFDNLVMNVAFGTYDYTFTRAGACDVTGTVVVDCSTIDAQSGNVPLFFLSADQTDASVFIGASSNMFGTFADGNINLTDGNNTYNQDVTEFDNLVMNVAFGTYDYTFTRAGACDVTGTVVVDCSTIDAQSGNVPLFFLSEDQTDASVFIGASSNMFGTFADGDITLTDGVNTYNKSVTEFDNLVTGVVFGTYDYTFTRPGACDVTGTLDVDCSTINAQSGNVPLFFLSEDQTDASVFIGASSNMFGTFADGNINLTDGNNTYNQDVTEFDNLVMNVAFGTYDYTFTRAGACDVTGTLDVDCSTINAQSGNVPLFFLSADQTDASVFIGASSNMFGTFADGNINLTDGNNTYNQDVTEFDNLVMNVAFGTYDYTFTRAGACDVTGTVVVDCSTIDAQSGNVPLFFLSADQTDASVFIGASSNMFGTFADGNINLTDGNNTYNQDVTEFDNLVMNVAFGTYDYTFTRAGACDVTGTVVVDCSTIDAQSGNVPLFFLSADQTDASVFIGASSNMFGTFADGNINLTDGNNTYNQDVTEFDNLVMNVAFGTYDYTFTRAGACDVTGTVVVDCSTIDAQSGNVPLFFLSADQTDASVFIGASSNMFGTFADGDITLTDGVNTYNKSVTEFDNLVTGVVFGTYDYTFTRPGACDVTGTLDVDCSTINAQSGNVPLFFLSEDQTDASVFIGASSNMFGTFADGNINLTDGNNTYNQDVTEFDNLVMNVAFGTYDYTFTRAGACDVTGTVVVDCSTIDAQSGNVPLFFLSADQTDASVFIGASSNMFGTFADGNINLTDGNNTYNQDVTEFDNLVMNVAFGTYDYTFTRAGACDVTGTVVVDCSTIDAQSGNVPLFFLSADQTDASVFIGASSNMFGTFADGNINLTDGNNTYNQDVTEFDNLVMNVAFGTYDYTFTRAGACDVTGTVVVDCSTIDAQSGNVPLFFLSEDQTDASVFIGASSNMFGTFADGDITLTDGVNTYNKSVTEFDNLVTGVVFGTYDYTFTRPGACDVTGTVEVGCSTIDSNSGNVPLFFLSEDATVDIGVDQVDNVLTANATGTSISYQWLDCNNGNALIDGETNQTFTASAIGSYAVVITDAACGVSDTSICYDVNSLSIDQIGSTLEVTLFPNPVKDNLSVSLNTSYDAIQLEIYALTGQLLKTISISNRSEFQVDISGLSAGMYLVRLNTEGKTYTSRILKN